LLADYFTLHNVHKLHCILQLSLEQAFHYKHTCYNGLSLYILNAVRNSCKCWGHNPACHTWCSKLM